MSELTVRRLRVDLETPILRHWCGGDAFRTSVSQLATPARSWSWGAIWQW